MTVGEYLYNKNIYIDEKERLHISVLCDSTAVFGIELADALVQLGCTDVKCGGYVDEKHAPQDKPWCSYRYTASGEMPIELKEDVLPKWEKWMATPIDLIFKEYLKSIYTNEETEYRQGTKWTH